MTALKHVFGEVLVSIAAGAVAFGGTYALATGLYALGAALGVLR
jgi:hypothetical protein